MDFDRIIKRNLGSRKEIITYIIDFAGKWMIFVIVLYGILPDNAKQKQGYQLSIVLAFLIALYFTFYQFRNKIMENIKTELQNNNSDKVNSYLKKLKSSPYVIASFINTWILFGLIKYSFLTDAQKITKVWTCFVFGFLIAIGFYGGKLFLAGKESKLVKSYFKLKETNKVNN